MLLTNRLFNDVLTDWDRAFFNEDYSYWRRGLGNSVRVRSRELDDSYEYYVPLAGFKKENVKANVEDGLVSVLAEQDENAVSCSVPLPEGADASSLEARLEDGLLTIKVTKKETERRIELKIS